MFACRVDDGEAAAVIETYDPQWLCSALHNDVWPELVNQQASLVQQAAAQPVIEVKRKIQFTLPGILCSRNWPMTPRRDADHLIQIVFTSRYDQCESDAMSAEKKKYSGAKIDTGGCFER